MQEKDSVGKSVDSYCRKCNLTVDHTIVAMEAEVITEVCCKSCGGSHKMDDPLAEKKVRKPRAKKQAATAEVVWATGLAEAKGKERDYSMASKYRVGDIVNHIVFGKGIVMKLYANKCDMLFKDRERLMASTNQ